MYPLIQLFGHNVFVVGLGLIVCLGIFMVVVQYYARKYNLKYEKFAASAWYFVLLPYIGGRYVATMVATRMVAPFWPLPAAADLTGGETIISEIGQRTRYWIVAIIAPFNYNFHVVGVMVGLCAAFCIFRWSTSSILEERKWIDTFVYALSLSSVMAGLFFVLGDTRVGKQTDAAIGIVGLSQDSMLSEYGGKVYPVGLFFSLLALVVYSITLIIQNFRRVYGMGIWGIIVFIVGINLLHVIMDYPRIGFITIGNWVAGIPLSNGNVYAFDLLNYTSLVLIGLILRYRRWLGDGRASAKTRKKNKFRDMQSTTLVGRQHTPHHTDYDDDTSTDPINETHSITHTSHPHKEKDAHNAISVGGEFNNIQSIDDSIDDSTNNIYDTDDNTKGAKNTLQK